MPALRRMSRQEIIDACKKGERNLSGIRRTEADFNGLDLSGADFSHSDLSFCSFAYCNLTGVNFSGAKLEWSSFEHATLRRTDFTKANATYTSFNDATFDKVIMRGTDLGWSLLFNVNWGEADSRGAMIGTVAFSPADVTEEGLAFVHSKLAALGKNADAVTHFLIESSVRRTVEAAKKKA